MKRLLFLNAAVAFGAAAQQPDPTPSTMLTERQACLAQKAVGKRSACLDALLTHALLLWGQEARQVEFMKSAQAVAESKARQQTKADDAERTKAALQALIKPFLAIRAAKDTGVSLNDYRPLVLVAATEVAQARAGAYGERGTAALPHLETSLQAYSDAGRWWQADVEFFARSDNRLAYPGGLPVGLARVDDLARYYTVNLGKADIWGIQRGAHLHPALGTIWAVADEAAEKAKASLDGALR